MVTLHLGPKMLALLLATTELNKCAATSLPPLLKAWSTPSVKQIYKRASWPGMPVYLTWLLGSKTNTFFLGQGPLLSTTPLVPARAASGPVT